MGQKYTHILSRFSLTEWVFFIFIASLLNLLRSPVLVVTLTKIDTGIPKSLEGKYQEKYSWYPSAPVRARRPPGIRIVVLGISKDTSWQVRGPPYLDLAYLVDHNETVQTIV
jgi:hypothetical protein